MKHINIFFKLAAFLFFASTVSSQDITFFFDTGDTPDVTGGSLVLTDSGGGLTSAWESDRFEKGSSTFEIQSIPTYGTLVVIANSFQGDLNVTGSGLGDGSSGYNAASEGTSFTFNQDVTITGFDFAAFTTAGGDSIELLIGAVSLGTFQEDTVVASVADFSNPNAVAASIDLSAGQPFLLACQGGSFHLEDLSFNVVPEPGAFALLSGVFGFASVALRRRL